MKIKKIVIAAAIATGISSNAFASGIPVVDVVGNLQAMLNHIEDVAKYVEQIEQLKAQLEQAEKTFDSMNGKRGMSALGSNISNDILPGSAMELTTVTDAMKGIKSGLQIIDPENIKNLGTRSTLDSQQNYVTALISSNNQAYGAATTRASQLQTFIGAVDSAEDPKAALDLGNRIQAQQAMLANEQIKLQLMKQVQDAQKEKLAQQSREDVAKMGNGTFIKPTRF